MMGPCLACFVILFDVMKWQWEGIGWGWGTGRMAFHVFRIPLVFIRILRVRNKVYCNIRYAAVKGMVLRVEDRGIIDIVGTSDGVILGKVDG